MEELMDIKFKKDMAPVSADYISWPLMNLSTTQALPGDIYLVINHNLVKYLSKGDVLSQESYNKFLEHGLKMIFIHQNDKANFTLATRAQDKDFKKIIDGAPEEARPILEAKRSLQRNAMDLFSNPYVDGQYKRAITTAKTMISAMMNKDHVHKHLLKIQKHEHGLVDHCVNVSALSVLLGMRLGYTHRLILEHLAVGGLLHDIGRVLQQESGIDLESFNKDDGRLDLHPKMGNEYLKEHGFISREVLLIVSQHHEFLDGSGFPEGLHAPAIYDLSRIVAIANEFDTLVSRLDGDLLANQEKALKVLQQDYDRKFDKQKLDKCTAIISELLMID